MRALALIAFVALLLVLAHVARASAASGPRFVGEVSGVAVYELRDGTTRCYVTAPQGGVSCVR